MSQSPEFSPMEHAGVMLLDDLLKQYREAVSDLLRPHHTLAERDRIIEEAAPRVLEAEARIRRALVAYGRMCVSQHVQGEG